MLHPARHFTRSFRARALSSPGTSRVRQLPMARGGCLQWRRCFPVPRLLIRGHGLHGRRTDQPGGPAENTPVGEPARPGASTSSKQPPRQVGTLRCTTRSAASAAAELSDWHGIDYRCRCLPVAEHRRVVDGWERAACPSTHTEQKNTWAEKNRRRKMCKVGSEKSKISVWRLSNSLIWVKAIRWLRIERGLNRFLVAAESVVGWHASISDVKCAVSGVRFSASGQVPNPRHLLWHRPQDRATDSLGRSPLPLSSPIDLRCQTCQVSGVGPVSVTRDRWHLLSDTVTVGRSFHLALRCVRGRRSMSLPMPAAADGDEARTSITHALRQMAAPHNGRAAEFSVTKSCTTVIL